MKHKRKSWPPKKIKQFAILIETLAYIDQATSNSQNFDELFSALAKHCGPVATSIYLSDPTKPESLHDLRNVCSKHAIRIASEVSPPINAYVDAPDPFELPSKSPANTIPLLLELLTNIQGFKEIMVAWAAGDLDPSSTVIDDIYEKARFSLDYLRAYIRSGRFRKTLDNSERVVDLIEDLEQEDKTEVRHKLLDTISDVAENLVRGIDAIEDAAIDKLEQAKDALRSNKSFDLGEGADRIVEAVEKHQNDLDEYFQRYPNSETEHRLQGILRELISATEDYQETIEDVEGETDDLVQQKFIRSLTYATKSGSLEPEKYLALFNSESSVVLSEILADLSQKANVQVPSIPDDPKEVAKFVNDLKSALKSLSLLFERN